MENDRFTLNAFQPDRIVLEADSNATGPNEHGNSLVVRSEGLIGRLGRVDVDGDSGERQKSEGIV